MSANTSWGGVVTFPPGMPVSEALSLASIEAHRATLGVRWADVRKPPGPRPERFVVMCNRCGDPLVPPCHRRLHARGKAPRCR